MSDPNNLVYREQLDDNVIDMLSEDIGSNYSLRTENTKTIASALNEIRGKDIIANAVGDPLLNTDSYNDMGSKIRELTVKLKNKLLSNGITIAEYDKLNSLIEKIEVLGGEGVGYGLEIITGECNDITVNCSTNNNWNEYRITTEFKFIPERIIFQSLNHNMCFATSAPYDSKVVVDSKYHYSEENYLNIRGYSNNSSLCYYRLYLSNFTTDGFSIFIKADGPNLTLSSNTFDAFGDGSSVLLDTLKNILINKGVVVTGSETLSELILKVDEIKPGSLNVISATNLPETGIDNQICIITDNPVDRFITTTNFDDTTGVSTDYITLYLGNTASFDATEGTLIELNQGNLLSRYYFVKACQGENRLDSYYWLNNQWNRLTQSGIYFVENGVERNHDYFGGIPAGPGAGFTTNGLTLLYSYNSPFKDVTTKNTINFSLYNKLDITIRNPDTSTSYYVCVGYASTDHFTSQGWYPTNSTGGNQLEYSNGTDAYQEIYVSKGQTVSQTIDISSWTGEGWLYLATFNGNRDLYITDLKLY